MLLSREFQRQACSSPDKFQVLGPQLVVKSGEDLPEPVFVLFNVFSIDRFQLTLNNYSIIVLWANRELCDFLQVNNVVGLSSNDPLDKRIQRHVCYVVQPAIEYVVHAFLDGLDLFGEFAKVVMNSFFNLSLA